DSSGASHRRTCKGACAMTHGPTAGRYKWPDMGDGPKTGGFDMKSDERIKMNLQLFADDGGDPNAGGDNNGGDNQDGAGDNAGDNAGKPEIKTITQEELDRIIQQRLQRERKKWEQQIEEERRKAAMTEAERLKAEKEEAERRDRRAHV